MYRSPLKLFLYKELWSENFFANSSFIENSFVEQYLTEKSFVQTFFVWNMLQLRLHVHLLDVPHGDAHEGQEAHAALRQHVVGLAVLRDGDCRGRHSHGEEHPLLRGYPRRDLLHGTVQDVHA